MTYNQRDSFQPQTFAYWNLGTRWTADWLGYITDDPTDGTQPVSVYIRGGGQETHTGYDPATGSYPPHRKSQAGGSVVLTRGYDAWGVSQIGTSEPGYAFTGREWDPEVALYYYRARYYDPTVGRFTSEEPLRAVRDRGHDYVYVLDNPAIWTDPTGLYPKYVPPSPPLPCMRVRYCEPAFCIWKNRTSKVYVDRGLWPMSPFYLGYKRYLDCKEEILELLPDGLDLDSADDCEGHGEWHPDCPKCG